jgi:hypothetical protein
LEKRIGFGRICLQIDDDFFKIRVKQTFPGKPDKNLGVYWGENKF